MIHLFKTARETVFTPEIICTFIKEHEKTHERYNKLKNYYDGEHKINQREKRSVLANNKLVCNHARYITDTAAGYFVGQPVKYSSKSNTDISVLTEILTDADCDTQDSDLAIKGSIFGVCYEFIYLDEESPKLCSPDPRNTFVIYDDTVAQKPLAGVYYYELYDSVKRVKLGYRVYCSTPSTLMEFVVNTGYQLQGEVIETPNGFKGVQIIEIYNNESCSGDFEGVISLIDAYNILQSDRVNDKEQFVDAILLIKGTVLGDDNEETSEAYKALKENGLLEMDESASAEWLTRQFDEASVELLRKSLENDIHKFANVPCMSDENFAGNVSGVAMSYKLLGFEQLTKNKENYFREGLKERIRLLCNYISTVGKTPAVNPKDINITFKRALPENETEKAQMVSELRDIVSNITLLRQLPFVEDAEAEADLVREQKENEGFPNDEPEDDDLTDE